MHLICAPREKILEVLPKQRRWAEIGVFRGDFSQTILDVCQPSELHLIDPWHFDLDFDYFAPSKSSRFSDPEGWSKSIAAWTGAPEGVHINDHFDAIARDVASRFAADPRVTIHRKMAHQAALEVPDQYFDFVYVDGAHDYENVLRDLTCYAPKLKTGGVILGDDYCEHGRMANAEYGVIGAVTHFRRIYKPTHLILNNEIFSFFGLFPVDSEVWVKIVTAALDFGVVIELPDSIAANYHHTFAQNSTGGVVAVQSFA